MKYRLMNLEEVCKTLNWGNTKYYERKNSGLFPKAVNLSGSKKGNLYFEHEIEFYIARAIHIKTEQEFRDLAVQIEESREELKNANAA